MVLAAGAVHSPQLLKLSGIGPREELEQHGIDVEQDLPAVGANLQVGRGSALSRLHGQGWWLRAAHQESTGLRIVSHKYIRSPLAAHSEGLVCTGSPDWSPRLRWASPPCSLRETAERPVSSYCACRITRPSCAAAR